MALSLYNKWMFSKHPNNNGRDNLNFPFPLFTTSVHMVVQFLGSWMVLQLLPRFKPPKSHSLTLKDYGTRIGPCGVATGLDIGFSNASLKTITLAFYTMCKSSSLAFVLLFAFLFKLERLRASLVLVIAIITAGVVLMVAHETRFVLEGFLLVMTASCLGGLRWALTQILLKENPSTANPFSSIYHLAPIMFTSLFMIAMILEGPVALIKAELWHSRGLMAIPILLFPSILAFLMTASEFGLIQRTSVVTLSVAGILKEVLTIGASAVIYGDALTLLNLSGLFVTILGIALYNVLRFRSMRKKVKQAVSDEQEGRLAESVPLRGDQAEGIETVYPQR
ncbi:triose-phosphate transporter family-domain-containing protein [Protomyces lactucae-debilis]|uniref:Triose-phosphate transporter family-domain-containing protein n=1 Tax=Protomyces lactucae-debilis TaxID=2754530 RepID=A0A1Y2EZP6_PROLT|nr:triose-phosphate transporter family-domain-containing protein [Protomyces lactucae-debilis]ORY77050.1 triose-phosphate transporter family-domain-containing protein [Protomyces lactucae-debilis]